MLSRLRALLEAEKEAVRLKQELAGTRGRLKRQRLKIENSERQIEALRSQLEDSKTASDEERSVVERFHRLYYTARQSGGTWFDTYWMGVPAWKCPLDMWIYQEILFETKPGFVIETGTAHGGSALFLAHMCDLLGKGRIVTIDIEEKPDRPSHDRITYLEGSSTSEIGRASCRERV